MSDLIDNGFVTRSWLGVIIQELDYETSQALNLQTRNGALITDVVDDSPAMLSGIQEGDVIIEFNGELITNPANLKNVVSLTAPQNNSRVKIIRDGAQQIVQVVLQELPKNPQQYSNQRKMKLDRFGFELKKINHNLREKYNLSSDNALVITQIDPDSEAFEKGIREGDIIKRVGTEKVLTISDFERMANSSQNNGAILILVKKPNGKSRFFTLNY